MLPPPPPPRRVVMDDSPFVKLFTPVGRLMLNPVPVIIVGEPDVVAVVLAILLVVGPLLLPCELLVDCPLLGPTPGEPGAVELIAP